ncbi:transcription initiation factor TFIIE subunit beta, partial [Tremellales sp. Uapishka_1]
MGPTSSAAAESTSDSGGGTITIFTTTTTTTPCAAATSAAAASTCECPDETSSAAAESTSISDTDSGSSTWSSDSMTTSSAAAASTSLSASSSDAGQQGDTPPATTAGFRRGLGRKSTPGVAGAIFKRNTCACTASATSASWSDTGAGSFATSASWSSSSASASDTESWPSASSTETASSAAATSATDSESISTTDTTSSSASWSSSAAPSSDSQTWFTSSSAEAIPTSSTGTWSSASSVSDSSTWPTTSAAATDTMASDTDSGQQGATPPADTAGFKRTQITRGKRETSSSPVMFISNTSNSWSSSSVAASNITSTTGTFGAFKTHTQGSTPPSNAAGSKRAGVTERALPPTGGTQGYKRDTQLTVTSTVTMTTDDCGGSTSASWPSAAATSASSSWSASPTDSSSSAAATDTTSSSDSWPTASASDISVSSSTWSSVSASGTDTDTTPPESTSSYADTLSSSATSTWSSDSASASWSSVIASSATFVSTDVVPTSSAAAASSSAQEGALPPASGASTSFMPRSGGNYSDPRTAAIELHDELKKSFTLSYHDAFYKVQDRHPHLDANAVLDHLKNLDRVEFKEKNQVFEYVPEHTITTVAQLRAHLRAKTTSTTGMAFKQLREDVPVCPPLLEEMEANGDILIMRSLNQGLFKDVPLPRLGGKNVNGLGLMEGGSARWRTIFWDAEKERGRAGNKVEDEFIHLWADVHMAETDDVTKLLADHDLGASSAIPPPPKVAPSGPLKKKRRTNRALKITNTHMKAQGIDFSQDYERAA